MTSFTITQWAIVALVFVAGWLLGLASHPGGRKWRERYTAERDAHAVYRKDADARLAAADERHRMLERDHARLATTTPVAPVTSGTTVVHETPVHETRVDQPTETVVIRPGDRVEERRV